MAGGGASGLGLLRAPAYGSRRKGHILVSGAADVSRLRADQLAKGKGYFDSAGLDVSFAVGRGGVDVAKQVGAGNAPIGGIVERADHGPRQRRAHQDRRVFGGKGFMQLVVREDSGIDKPADLKGKTITVMSYQDTTFYALLGLLASAGLTQDDVNIQSVGPTGVWEFVATGKSVGMAGVPDWIRRCRPPA